MPYYLHHHSLKQVVCISMLCVTLHNLDCATRTSRLVFFVGNHNALVVIVGYISEFLVQHYNIFWSKYFWDFFQLCIGIVIMGYIYEFSCSTLWSQYNLKQIFFEIFSTLHCPWWSHCHCGLYFWVSFWHFLIFLEIFSTLHRPWWSPLLLESVGPLSSGLLWRRSLKRVGEATARRTVHRLDGIRIGNTIWIRLKINSKSLDDAALCID